MRGSSSPRFEGHPLTGREVDLFEAVAHAMAVQTEPLLKEHHKQWTEYHLNRALLFVPQKVADTIGAALEKFTA